MGEIKECPRCGGSGEIDGYWTCGDPACCGSGLIDCPDCDGRGTVHVPEATPTNAGGGNGR